VIAPHVERSACGRMVTLDLPLRAEEIATRRLAVNGTPADCVLLAVRKLLPAAPDAVVSGINRGLNVGEDVDYSGTVGAAAEGALQGCRASVAVSMASQAYPRRLPAAGELTCTLVEGLLDNPLPPGTYLNVNLPAQAAHRVRITRQGNPLGTGEVLVGEDPRGKRYFWIAERPDEDDPPDNTDRGAVRAGCISISLLTLDRNHRGSWQPPPLGEFEEDPK